MPFPPKAADKDTEPKPKGPPKMPFGSPRGKAPAKDVVAAARKGDTGARGSLALNRPEGMSEDDHFKSLEGDMGEMDMGDELDDPTGDEKSPHFDDVKSVLEEAGVLEADDVAKRICDIFDGKGSEEG